MQITFVLPVVNLSGGTKVVGIYARELMRRGHTVRIIAPPSPAVPFYQKLKRWVKGGRWIPDRTNSGSHLDDLGVNVQTLDTWRPVVDNDVPNGDVVIATWWETAEWVNALSPNKGAKVYFIQHHEVFNYLPKDRCRETYRFKFHKIVVAEWLKQIMQNDYHDTCVELVPNSVDRAQFYPSLRSKQEFPTIGFLYASAEFKGVDTTLAVLKRLVERHPALKVVSFGSLEVKPHLPLPRGTTYHRSPAQDEIRRIYGCCDVWLTASRSEGFNLPAMEAMACGTPVVSTRTGWPGEAIVSGLNGWLADVDNIDELTYGVEWLLALDEPAWKRVSESALSTVGNTSWESSAVLFEVALMNACERAVRGEIAGLPISVRA